MTSDRRLEQNLPDLLDDLYMGPMPAYRDQILEQTARTRQRPAWSIPERWLPMVDIARQPVLVPRLPWRSIGLGFVLLALLVAMVAALVVGSRPNLPLPFGPARNGLIAYASGGDIYTVDPVTGNSTAIVSGPETDINPRWSRDGTRIAFERKDSNADFGFVYVARADGTEVTQVTPERLVAIQSYDFSPDGVQLLITEGFGAYPRVHIAAADGSQIRRLDVNTGMPIVAPSWRPDGSEILFMDAEYDGNIQAVTPDGRSVRTILNWDAGRSRGNPLWSPDGSLISYMQWRDSPNLTAEIHVIAADGTGDRILPMPTGAVWQAAHAWSNDGTRLLAVRGYTGDGSDARAVVIPADGSGTGTEVDAPGDFDGEWAPDDSSILGTLEASDVPLDQIMVDPATGASRELPWKTVSQPSWQRLAP